MAKDYLFPATRFSGSDDLLHQLRHVLSEAAEIEVALKHGVSFSDPEEEALLEFMDLYHSCETLRRMLERLNGKDYLRGLVQLTEGKNRVRGYYGATDEDQA